MAAYIVTYDLNHQKEWGDYTDLIDEIKKLGGFRTQKSVWLVTYGGNAIQLFQVLRAHMHDDDFLFVAELQKGISWRSASYKGTNDWMTKNVGASH